MKRSSFSISPHDEDGWLVLSLAGSVDASTFQDFEEQFTQLVEGGALFVRLEMQELRSINSTGLGLLLATYRHLRQSNGRLEIRGLSPEITNVFNLLGLSRLLGEEPDEGAAGVVAR